MILYHFTTSPYSRRVRLALAFKGLHVELRDARADADHAAALRGLNPLHTVPVLVDEQRVLCDSAAICQYLERKHPDPPLWSSSVEGAEAFELTALADGAITPIIDMGLRYAPLDGDTRFEEVRANMIGRVQRALDVLAQRIEGRKGALLGSWGAVDMAVFTMVVWLETMPTRATSFPPAKKMMALGWNLPAALTHWADQHRARPDVLALQ